MGIVEKAKQMVGTGSFEMPEDDKNKPENQPKKPEDKPMSRYTRPEAGARHDGAEKEHKPNPVIKYFKEVRDELKKVEWPKRQEVIRGTIVVIVLSVALALILGASDEGFSYLLQKALTTFTNTSL